MDWQGAGWRLRAARAELGLTEDALAHAMRRWAEIRNEARPDITAEAVAEWEGGLRPLDPPTMRLLWLALEVPGWDWAGHAVDTWSLFRPSRPAANQGQRRRDLVRSLAALGRPVGLDPERLSGALEETLKVDGPLVEGLTFVARRFPKDWGQQPPQALRQHVHAHLQVVHALLDGLMPGGSRRELESAAATTATVGGLISLLVDQHEDSGIYLRIGARLAESAGDAEAHALALMLSSYLSSAIEPDAASPNPALARAQIEGAVRLVSPGTAPLARAWVLLRAAQEHAWARDELGAYRLLDEAEQLGSIGQIPADGLVSPWTADTHLTFQGEVAAMCGRHDQAIALLEDGLTKLGPDRVARHTRALSDLAAAYARQGSIDHACELLVQAFEVGQRAGVSERIQRIVAVRDRYLAAHAAEPAVRRLDELVLAR
jgi:transcriptional regulator with XRE-family HTH domain